MLTRTIDITFELGRKDLARASRFMNWRKRGPRQIILLLLMGLLTAMLFKVTSGGSPFIIFALVVGWAMPSLTLFFILVYYPWRAGRGTNESPVPMNVQWLIREEGVDLRGPKIEAKAEWGIWSTFHETEDAFYLLQPPMLIHILPKAAFANREDLDAVRDLLKRKFPERPSALPF